MNRRGFLARLAGVPILGALAFRNRALYVGRTDEQLKLPWWPPKLGDMVVVQQHWGVGRSTEIQMLVSGLSIDWRAGTVKISGGQWTAGGAIAELTLDLDAFEQQHPGALKQAGWDEPLRRMRRGGDDITVGFQ